MNHALDPIPELKQMMRLIESGVEQANQSLRVVAERNEQLAKTVANVELRLTALEAAASVRH